MSDIRYVVLMAPRTQSSETIQTRNVPSLALRAAVRPGSVDAEARTVEVVWTSGARVLRGFFDKFYEELSLDPKHVRMERLASGRAPVLDSHSSWRVEDILGVVESARLEKKQGIAVLRFPRAEDDEAADRIFRKLQDGILGNVSVGYRVHRFEKVEGGDEEIPVYRAVDWEPYEISIVGMGADPAAGTRAAEGNGSEMPCEFVSRKENTMGAENQVRETPAPAPAAEPQASAASAENAARAAAESATRAERERITGIRSAVRAARLGDEVADELITSGTPLDQARATVLERLAAASDAAPPSNNVRVQVTDDELDKFRRGASAWLLEKTGTRSIIEQAKAKGARGFETVELDPGEFRGLSLLDLARESLERRGERVRGMDKMSLVGKAFTARAYQGTSDFGVLLESVLHKQLLGAYAIQPDSWSRFCKTDTVPDFRPSNRYRTGSFDVLDSLNEHGEFKNKAIPDGEKSTISVGTKGNIIAITRELVVNDDMSALSDLATRLGRAARLSIEVDVFALLAANGGLGPTMADGQPFFHASRGNVNDTGSALTVAGLDADRVVMASQRDPGNNEFLDLRPVAIVLPIGLGGEARVINEAQYDPGDNKFQKPNKVRGLFREVVDTPRLSGTRRYLFADPGIAPAIVVAFLEGQGEAPVLESKEGWRVDGVEWRVRLDYRAQAFDPRGAVTNAGA